MNSKGLKSKAHLSLTSNSDNLLKIEVNSSNGGDSFIKNASYNADCDEDDKPCASAYG